MPYNPQGSGGGISKLSELAIDTDKDWLGYGITNIEGVAAGMVAGSVIQKGLAGILVNLPPGVVAHVLTSQGPGALVKWLPGGTYYNRYFPVEFFNTPAAALVTPDGSVNIEALMETLATLYNNSPTEAPELALLPAVALVTPDGSANVDAAMAITATERNLYHPMASGWDCYRYWTGAVWNLVLASTSLKVGYDSASELKCGGGHRFLINDIPNAATIDSAYIWVKAKTLQEAATVKSQIEVEDVDDAAIFTNEADYIARARVAGGGIAWDAIPQWHPGQWYKSPAITVDIQAVVNRALWLPGQHMVVFWHDELDLTTHSVDTFRDSGSFDSGVFDGIRLEINWHV